MTRAERIEAQLRMAFEPESLSVIDQSAQHIGHAGYQEGGESHFRVVMVAPQLAGVSRVQQHRAIHSAIGPELMGEIHALAIDLKTA